MKTRKALINIAFLLGTLGICQAQETKKGKLEAGLSAMPVIKQVWDDFDLLGICRGKEAKRGKLEVDLSTTLVSKHMWHGFDLLDDHGAFIPVVGLNFEDTGFSGKVIAVQPLSSGFEDSVELDYAAFYKGTFLKGTRYVTNLTANYFYYGKPNEANRKADTQEIGIGFCWPELITVGNSSLTTNYYFGSLWPSRSNSPLSGCEGFIHVFGLGYDLTLPTFWAGKKEQTFSFFGDITYNDGFGGKSVDSDWSHAVIGVRTNLGSGNLTVTPAIYYQISMDDSVNDEDELWCGISLTYSF